MVLCVDQLRTLRGNVSRLVYCLCVGVCLRSLRPAHRPTDMNEAAVKLGVLDNLCHDFVRTAVTEQQTRTAC